MARSARFFFFNSICSFQPNDSAMSPNMSLRCHQRPTRTARRANMPLKRQTKSPAAQRPARGALMTAVIIAAIASNASKPGRKSDPKTLAAVELVSQYFELIVIIIIIPCKLFWDNTCIRACSSLVQNYRRKRLSIKQGLLARPVTLPSWHEVGNRCPARSRKTGTQRP